MGKDAANSTRVSKHSEIIVAAPVKLLVLMLAAQELTARFRSVNMLRENVMANRQAMETNEIVRRVFGLGCFEGFIFSLSTDGALMGYSSMS